MKRLFTTLGLAAAIATGVHAAPMGPAGHWLLAAAVLSNEQFQDGQRYNITVIQP